MPGTSLAAVVLDDANIGSSIAWAQLSSSAGEGLYASLVRWGFGADGGRYLTERSTRFELVVAL